jgi:hypothetical protein
MKEIYGPVELEPTDIRWYQMEKIVTADLQKAYDGK